MIILRATILGRHLGTYQYNKQKAADRKKTDILNQFKGKKIQPVITIEK